MASSSVRYVALQNSSFAKVYLDHSKGPPEVIQVSIVSHLDVDENNRDIYDTTTINMSSAGSDAKISGSKIEPLDSDVKSGEPTAESGGGAAGTDQKIDQARLDPVGGAGQYQNPAPHADDHGAVGRDAGIAATKIDPLAGVAQSEHTEPETGLKDEEVDAARVEPMGSVREEMK